ncbi:MAG: hypothetical protein ABIH38_05395 [Patescibacteria group bacterium]
MVKNLCIHQIHCQGYKKPTAIVFADGWCRNNETCQYCPDGICGNSDSRHHEKTVISA